MAAGIVTARGGMTSHAAVVARGMGRCCIVGVSSLEISLEKKQMFVLGRKILEGDTITLDGYSGEIFLGSVPLVEPNWEAQKEYTELMSYVDQFRKLLVLANADTAQDAQTACRFGAEGIGLCRTEHMFFAEDRRFKMLRMILADSLEERRKHCCICFPCSEKILSLYLRK